MNGNARPAKFEPPPVQPTRTSGYASAISSCAIASSPITVWCRSTWLSTEPSAYFVSSRCAACSTASEIAIPRLPVESGCSARIGAAGVRLLRRARHAARAERLHERAAVRLLVVRDPHHEDLDLDAEERAGERERRAPLPGAGLGRDPLDALALVVERLRDRGVRLVAARRRDAFVLVVDARGRLERVLEPAGAVERRGPPLAVDVAHLLGNRDPLLGRDLLQDQLHREERREVVGAERLPRARVQHAAAAAPGGRPRGCTRRPACGSRRACTSRSRPSSSSSRSDVGCGKRGSSRSETRSSSATAYSAKRSSSSTARVRWSSAASDRPARAWAQARL